MEAYVLSSTVEEARAMADPNVTHLVQILPWLLLSFSVLSVVAQLVTKRERMRQIEECSVRPGPFELELLKGLLSTDGSLD